MRRPLIIIAALALVLGACTVIDLTANESHTVTCPEGQPATWDDSGEHMVVLCGGSDGTMTIVTCSGGESVATQVDASTIRVDCVNTTPPTTTTTVPPTTTTTVPLEPAIWHGDADTDIDRGDQTDCMDKNTGTLPTSRLSIVDDPQGLHGKVYKAELLATDSGRRAEWNKSFLNCDGNTKEWLWEGTDRVRYIGWRSLFGDGVNLNGDGNYLQWKGDSSCGGPAVGMTLVDGHLTLRTIDGDPPGMEGVWIDPLPLADRLNVWTDFVMAVNFSKGSGGWIELTVNGDPQILNTGTTRHEGPTVCPNDATVRTKWGVYSMNDGNPVHWTSDPRIGNSYESVVPQ